MMNRLWMLLIVLVAAVPGSADPPDVSNVRMSHVPPDWRITWQFTLNGADGAFVLLDGESQVVTADCTIGDGEAECWLPTCSPFYGGHGTCAVQVAWQYPDGGIVSLAGWAGPCGWPLFVPMARRR